jgi:hypothetical protein
VLVELVVREDATHNIADGVLSTFTEVYTLLVASGTSALRCISTKSQREVDRDNLGVLCILNVFSLIP